MNVLSKVVLFISFYVIFIFILYYFFCIDEDGEVVE